MAISSLIGWLAAGVRGCESGTAEFYQPGGLVAQAVYKDSACAQAWPAGAVGLDTNGRAIVFANALCRIIVKDSTGAVVFDDVGNSVDDGTVRIDSSHFNGGLPTHLNAELEAATAQFGNTGFAYKVSSSPSAVAMSWQNWANQVQVNVKAFGAIGDDTADDTNAIQQAINLVIGMGGGVVFFPPGVYKTTNFLNVSSTNVALVGAGMATSAIHVNAARDALMITGGTADDVRPVYVGDMSLYGAPAGQYDLNYDGISCLSLNNVSLGSFRDAGSGTTDRFGVTCYGSNIGAAELYGEGGGEFVSTSFGALSLMGSAAGYGFANCFVRIGVTFDAGLTGTGFSFDGGYIAGITCNVATDPNIHVSSSVRGLAGYTVNVAAGGSHTPDRTKGRTVRIRAAGATATVNAPTPAPSSYMRGELLTLELVNGAGGAVVWTMDAKYRVSAAIDGTDGKTTALQFMCDSDITPPVWREISRVQTTT